MPKACPQCNAVVKDLKSHIRKQHPTLENEPASRGTEDQTENTQENTSESLEVTGAENAQAAAKTFHCVSCGHGGITKGQAECPNCGEPLDWSGISED